MFYTIMIYFTSKICLLKFNRSGYISHNCYKKKKNTNFWKVQELILSEDQRNSVNIPAETNSHYKLHN